MVTFEAGYFDPESTFECGQCFRWRRGVDGSYRGIARGRELVLRKDGTRFSLSGVNGQEFRELFYDYFDLGRDYGAIDSLLRSDPVLRRAADFAPGLRILRQEPWEALCSFIISQNNNIPRIRGIVERLCETFGDELPGGGHAFPPPECLAGLTLDDLSPLRSGFRAGYLLDAAQKVASGEVDLSLAARMPIADARAMLRTIRGVGPKVAECALLFGCGRAECFPVDVWIGRAMKRYYPDGLPQRFAPVAGIAQQVLFHYVRCAPKEGAARIPA